MISAMASPPKLEDGIIAKIMQDDAVLWIVYCKKKTLIFIVHKICCVLLFGHFLVHKNLLFGNLHIYELILSKSPSHRSIHFSDLILPELILACTLTHCTSSAAYT